mmetsp:Transcript_8708/g.12376  ORF Transcript_8708/g.12376 Transcript_8708/m.12376 type:complete len:82 (+) Transcript_8708:1387-1632(+)
MKFKFLMLQMCVIFYNSWGLILKKCISVLRKRILATMVLLSLEILQYWKSSLCTEALTLIYISRGRSRILSFTSSQTQNNT